MLDSADLLCLGLLPHTERLSLKTLQVVPRVISIELQIERRRKLYYMSEGTIKKKKDCDTGSDPVTVVRIGRIE